MCEHVECGWLYHSYELFYSPKYFMTDIVITTHAQTPPIQFRQPVINKKKKTKNRNLSTTATVSKRKTHRPTHTPLRPSDLLFLALRDTNFLCKKKKKKIHCHVPCLGDPFSPSFNARARTDTPRNTCTATPSGGPVPFFFFFFFEPFVLRSDVFIILNSDPSIPHNRVTVTRDVARTRCI